MGYQPIFEGVFDIALDEESNYRDLLKGIFAHKLTMTGFSDGPPTGTTVKLRGTRRQLLDWVRGYLSGHPAQEEENDDDAWAEIAGVHVEQIA